MKWPLFFLLQLKFYLGNFEEMYLFANEGENHTNNVKQLEEMKKGTEETREFWELKTHTQLNSHTILGKSEGPL